MNDLIQDGDITFRLSEIRLLEFLVSDYLNTQQNRRHKAITRNAERVRESDGEFAMRMEPLTSLRKRIAEFLDQHR